MSTSLSKWNKEDLQMHKILDDLLSKKASWNLSTSEAVQLYRSLVWFAQLHKKMEDSQAEITRVITPEEQQAKPKSDRKPKQKNSEVSS